MQAAVLLLACGATGPAGAESGVAVLARVGAESDADDFAARVSRVGALVDYESHLRHAGLALQNTRYSFDGWNEDVVGVVALYRNQRRDTLAGVHAEAGLASVSGRVRPIGDVTWSLRPRESTGVELIAAADVVGTRRALDESVTFGLAAVSADQRIGERLTVVGLAGRQRFTDGNARDLARARVIWSALPAHGVSLQARWKQYASEDRDVGGAYFNPGRYRNWDGVLSVRRRHAGWTVTALAGAGQERVDDGAWRTTKILDVGAEGPLAGRSRVAVGVLYMRAAGFVDSPDYWYGTATMNVIVPLGR